MQHSRKTLSLSPALKEGEGSAGDPADLIARAIAHELCVRARYNRLKIMFAPHVLFARHGDLFVDAVVVEREGLPPKDVKLGTFKIAGLSSVGLTDQPLAPRLPVDVDDPKYAESIRVRIGG